MYVTISVLYFNDNGSNGYISNDNGSNNNGSNNNGYKITDIDPTTMDSDPT